jgi:hypothetical protein
VKTTGSEDRKPYTCIHIYIYIIICICGVFNVAAVSKCVVVDDTGDGDFRYVLLEVSSAQRLIAKSLTDLCSCMLYKSMKNVAPRRRPYPVDEL